MGTKIEFAIDPLVTSPNNKSFTLKYRVDDWDYFQTKRLKNFQRTGLDKKFRDSMDKKLEKHNIESIKRTMQIQEDMFKHQVQELHRLYTVQKMLTAELKKEFKQNSRIWSSIASSDINHSQFRNHLTRQQNSGYILNFQNINDDPISSRERSGSCSGETMKMARGFDLERPAVEDMSTAVSAIDEDQTAGPSNTNKMSIDGSDEDSEVQLTLSIGVVSSSSSKNKKKPKSYHPLVHSELDSPASIKCNRGEDFSSPSTPISSSSATFDQEKKMPHWLFGLSINRS